MTGHPYFIQIHDFFSGQLGIELRRNQVPNDRVLPVPHTAACLQSSRAAAEPPLAPSLPPEAKGEAKDNKPPGVVSSGPEHPAPISGSFGCFIAKLWCSAGLQVSEQAALTLCGRGCCGLESCHDLALQPSH